MIKTARRGAVGLWGRGRVKREAVNPYQLFRPPPARSLRSDGVGEGESTDSPRKAFFIHGAMIKGRGRSALPKGLLGVRAAPP